MLDGLLPTRSAEDLWSEVIRVRLGSEEYVLPVLPRGANRRWQAQVEGEVSGLFTAIEAGGNDMSAILGVLVTMSDRLLELLMAYDETGVLPSTEVIDETTTEIQIVRAIAEVWVAANPFVRLGLAAMTPDQTSEHLTSVSTPSTSSAQPSTAGRRARSSRTSPTSSSTNTSSRPTPGSNGRTGTSTKRPSKPTGSATSSRAMPMPSAATSA